MKQTDQNKANGAMNANHINIWPEKPDVINAIRRANNAYQV